MMKVIDPKYHIENETIVKTLTGEPVPDDEPLILFRARDRLALPMLRIYKVLSQMDGCSEYHMNGVNTMINVFLDFSIKHPDRMKQPGITQGR
jgi:hypothetical protein